MPATVGLPNDRPACRPWRSHPAPPTDSSYRHFRRNRDRQDDNRRSDDGNQRRDYIYVDDLIDLAMRVWDQPGFDAVNVSSNKNYSVRELYATACELMGKQIEAKSCPSSHYWAKYPELYGGAYGIKPEILDHEVNKYSLCDNTHAKECYGWEPKIDIREGLRRVIENECAMLAARDAKGE